MEVMHFAHLPACPPLAAGRVGVGHSRYSRSCALRAALPWPSVPSFIEKPLPDAPTASAAPGQSQSPWRTPETHD